MKFLVALSLSIACVAPVKSQMVRDWLVLGAFPHDSDATRLTSDYLGGDSTVVPRGGEQDGGKRWILYHSPHEYLNFLDPDLPFGVTEHCAAYAAFFVQSPGDAESRFLVGSDDGVQIFCNGRTVHFNDVYRGLQLDNDTVVVPLKAGWNTLLCKVVNGEGGYALSVRVAGPPGLTVAAENPSPAARLLSGPALMFPPSSPPFVFRLSDDNRAEAVRELTVINGGERAAEEVRLTMARGDRKLSEAGMPRIAPGELVRLSQQMSFEEALSSDGPGDVEFRLSYNGRDTARSYHDGQGVLPKLFSEWEFPGWKEAAGEDSMRTLTRTVVVPDDLAGLGLEFTVNIGDAWGSLSINGKEILHRFGGDAGDISLTSAAVPGDTFRIVISAEVPKHGTVPLLQSSSLKLRNSPIERYLADVRFGKEIYHVDLGDQAPVMERLTTLLKTHKLDGVADVLKGVNDAVSPYVPKAKSLSLSMIGNAHIDMAWLWRYTETMDVVKRTFEAAVDNLRRYPDFTFSHGQAQTYAWMEAQDPELFAEIRKYVKEGRWEIVGGTWVESDANMPSGESLIRQYLYGKRYFRKKFGVDVKHGWYPDTFGHAATLPQILAKSGIETYSFFRPWDEERAFWWESPDGSRVFAHRPPNWYGTWTGIPDTVCVTALRARDALGIKDAARFYGVGDHGGGPTRREIETVHRLADVDLYPTIGFSTFDAYYRKFEAEEKNAPVKPGEQNFVFDGCYTSQTMVKQENRKAEALLPTAEMFSAIATRYGYPYPSDSLEEAWHRVLFNQVHDVMCGSGIHDIYTDAKAFYDEASRKAERALGGALGIISSHVRTVGRNRTALPLLVFNPLNWPVSAPVSLTIPGVPSGRVPRIVNEKGRELPSQVIRRANDSVECLFVPTNLPPVGFSTYWVDWKKEVHPKPDRTLRLENKFLLVQIDPQTGAIKRIRDKTSRRELLADGAAANQFEIQDDDAPMSAWVIGLKGVPRILDSALSVTVLETGSVRKTVRVVQHVGNSTLTQDIMMYRDLPRVDVAVSADWHERRKMLKIVFPWNIPGAVPTFEIPDGAIQREANGKEVVMQKWLDCSGADYGVSLVNDSKYGCSVRGDTVMLTALRSSTDPDPRADEGFHRFSYALIPHRGTWKEASTVQRAYEFNTPLIPMLTSRHQGDLAPSFSFLRLDAPDVVITALKKCEDDSTLVVRCYETTGARTRAVIRCWLPVDGISETNLMEWDARPLAPAVAKGTAFEVPLGPWEIKTLKLAIEKKR